MKEKPIRMTCAYGAFFLFVAACGKDDAANPQVDAGLDAQIIEADVRPDSNTIGDVSTNNGVDAADVGPTSTGMYGPAAAFFYQDVSGEAAAAESDAMIGALRSAGGWGNNDLFQIDFSLDVLTADASTTKRAFEPSSAFYSPDCDPAPIPVPENGNIEGEDGYACVGDGDCHLLVHAPDENRLYEMWRADIQGNTFQGGCLAIWDTSKLYPEVGRGDQCTSADAAGFPITPLLFTADEVAAGEINHAIRFILPNNRVRQKMYVRPATHGTNTTGGPDAPPYGVHFRLRADYPLDTLPNDGARVVARALQKYGMYHADGGNIALTAQSDRHTTAKWEGLLSSRDLKALDVEDFEVIHHSDAIPVTFDCVRTPISQ